MSPPERATGLSSREAARRLEQHGPNVLSRRGGPRWPRELARQFTHPLALLLWAAAALAWVAGIAAIAVAIVVVILLNAVFAFAQELQAERAVDALAAYLPAQARVVRDGRETTIDAAGLVPGDLLVIEEGARVSADGRLVAGGGEFDLSTLTGESTPVAREAGAHDPAAPPLEATDRVFSGTSCVEGEGRAIVTATGMRTELGRIAALSQRVEQDESPLEAQVRRVAWLIAVIAVVTGAAFVPLAMLGAGLPVGKAVVFAVGLLVGNVPEGLLPVITLALAVGVRELARRGAVVKRLSAVETLGSTSVICTDKTGTLTENRMRPTAVWTAAEAFDLDGGRPPAEPAPAARALATVIAACNNADPETGAGDPTEGALLAAARALGVAPTQTEREQRRRAIFHFDPALQLMTTIDERDGCLWADVKGSPEAVLSRCAIGDAARAEAAAAAERYAGEGLRVLGVATRRLADAEVPRRREGAEHDLRLLGFVAMIDPPRAHVAAAVASCQAAGIRIIVVTGDHGLTAAAIARRVGIARGTPAIVTGRELDAMDEAALDEVLRERRELIFARTSPEAKLRIADALRAEGEVVAMTGDGVNDAPALRRADIGVAMGRSGTDVAREAAAMVLTDDDFATIVAAIAAGRRVYDNIRKFILYIFAHATPEVVPFLIYALSGGAVPLPLPVLQLLAFDVGTETLPALALGREPAEPGLMARPPRRRSESVIRTPMLLRAWLFLGAISAVLAMTAFFAVLLHAGWRPGAATGAGSALHHDYHQATSMTLLAMVAGQVGTAFAARTERASLRSVGFASNRLLLWGIAFELLLTAALIYAPPFQSLLGTAGLTPWMLLLVLPIPPVVWGADELRRLLLRRRAARQDRGSRRTSTVAAY